MRSSVGYWFGWLLILFVAMPMGELGVKNANAGTGYIDAQGRWHLSVAFIQPSTGQRIDEAEWLEVFKLADEMLYRTTNGKHQFGPVTLLSRQHYDTLVDVIIMRDPDRSYADVYGVNRLGYQIFLSDQLRTSRSRTDLAKLLLHALGHYLYSLYDEYRNQIGTPLPQTPPPFRAGQCVNTVVSSRPLDKAACLMETLRSEIKTWCFDENHEIDFGNQQRARTWQSQDNDSLSCWSTMKRLYPLTINEAANPPFPDSVNMSRFVPLSTIPRAPHTELVIAIDGNSLQSRAEALTTLQTLLRIFGSSPESSAAVVFIIYNGNQILSTAPIAWDDNLRANFTSHLQPVPFVPGANIDALLNETLRAFATLASTAGGLGGVSRTLLLLTSGTENPALPAPSTTIKFREQNIRTLICLVKSLPASVLKTYGEMAAAIGGTVHDATSPSVRAYSAAEVAGKQTVAIDAAVIPAPGRSVTFTYTIPDSMTSAILSVHWTDADCDVVVTVTRNGKSDSIVAINQNDIVGQALKARRYSGLRSGETLIIEARAPNRCTMTPLPVALSLTDENPTIFLTTIAERLFYGTNDNEVVHARVTAPYPLINPDEFVAGPIDSLGKFLNNQVEAALDDGVGKFGTALFDGDWVEGDGIHSKIYKSLTNRFLRTIRFRVINRGLAQLAPGEAFSGSGSIRIPRFQREAFVTYFVDPGEDTNLRLQAFKLDSIPWPPTNLNLDVTGTFRLPSHYPHAFSIDGTINGKAVKIDANTIKVNLRDIIGTIQLDTLKLAAALKVRYRTGDSLLAQARLIFPRPVGVEENPANIYHLPQAFRLYTNYPNPFNLNTRLRFDLPKRSDVSLMIYDVLGRKIRTLIAGSIFEPGLHWVDWDGRTNDGMPVGSGVYFVRAQAAGQEQVQKILLMK